MIALETVVHSGLFVGLAVTLLWLLSLQLRDVSIVDIWWGPGFAVIAWTASSTPLDANLRYGAALCLLTLWAVRLGTYLWIRNSGHPEDRRYQAIRAATPGFPLKSLFTVFWLQGALQLLVARPVLLGRYDRSVPHGVGPRHRGGCRRAAPALQGGAGQCRKGDGPRPLGVESPP